MTESSDDSRREPKRGLPAWYTSGSAFPMYEHLTWQGFPTVQQLRRGILLGCIAHSLWLAAHEGMFAHNHQWDGDTYADDNDQGERWAVTFRPEGAVAVFYTNESERNPFPPGSPPDDQAVYFRGMPDSIRKAKERSLSWMINLEREMGGPTAAITAAMWADGERFTAAEPWEGVFRNCAWACYKQLLPFDVALVEWQDNCDLTDEDLTILCSLYRRRLAATEAVIPVEPWERKAFLRCREAAGPGPPRDDPGLSAARDALAGVGIALRDWE